MPPVTTWEFTGRASVSPGPFRILWSHRGTRPSGRGQSSPTLSSMQLFVTGGTGFVGSHFVQQALAAGHGVRALRRPGSQSRIPLPHQPDWFEIPFDQVEARHFENIDAVVHLAAHSANVPYDSLENCLHW